MHQRLRTPDLSKTGAFACSQTRRISQLEHDGISIQVEFAIVFEHLQGFLEASESFGIRVVLLQLSVPVPLDFFLACLAHVLDILGIHLREVFFQPTFNKWENEVCGGLHIHVTDARTYKPYVTTLAIIQDIITLYPHHFAWRTPPYEYEKEKIPVDIITGDKNLREGIERQKEIADLEKTWQKELQDFKKITQSFLLYN